MTGSPDRARPSRLLKRAWPVALLGLTIGCAGPTDPVAEEDAALVGDALPADTGATDTERSDTDQPDADQPDADQPDTEPTDTAAGDTAHHETLSADAGPCSIDGLVCDDGNPCTSGDHCVAGECVAGTNLCACKVDADCDATDKCHPEFCDQTKLPFACKPNPGAAVLCSTAGLGACEVATCDPAVGTCKKSANPLPLACDDGVVCTVFDSCQSGECKGVDGGLCDCDSDADCPDDGDSCNGVAYCDKAGGVHKCRVNKATVISCPQNSKEPCSVNVCQPANGKCALDPLPDGSPCNDGDTKTINDVCGGGACAGYDPKKCNASSDCADDGDKCNGVPFCDKATGSCQLNPASVVTCPTVNDTACLKNVCITAVGVCQPTALEGTRTHCETDKSGQQVCAWQLAPAGQGTSALACDDGDACTDGDICAAGKCDAGKYVCGCSSDGDCVDDGDKCNGGVFCNKAVKGGACQQNPGQAITCPTTNETPCIKNACAKATGKCALTAAELAVQPCPAGPDGVPAKSCRWVQLPAGTTRTAACDDSDACTVGDVCANKSCIAGPSKCACASDSDCVDQDDGNLCNGVLFCDKSVPTAPVCKAKPASAVKCSTAADTACHTNACAAQTGTCALRFAERTALFCAPNDPKDCRREELAAAASDATVACEDGSPCTAGDFCFKSKCFAGPKAPGCECFVNADCDHKVQDKCLDAYYCDKTTSEWQCKKSPFGKVFCNEPTGSTCLTAACDSLTGKCVQKPINQGSACDDGDPCKAGESCQAGECTGAKAKDCNDLNACTVDTCDAKLGCVNKPAGTCADGNACTADTCDPKTGDCHNDSKPLDAKSCDADDDPCTPTDACTAGVCKAGSRLTCSHLKGSECEQPRCIRLSATTRTCELIALENQPCATAATCTLGATCKQGKCEPGTKPRFYSRTHAPANRSAAFVAAFADAERVFTVGRSWTANVASPTSAGWWLASLDNAGEAVWSQQILAPTAHSAVGANAIARLGSKLIVVGTTATAQTGRNAQIAVVTLGAAAKQVTVEKISSFGKPDMDEAALAVAVDSNQAVFIGGSQAKGGAENAWLLRLNSAAGYLVDHTYPDTKTAGTSRISGIVMGADGNAVLAGDAGQTLRQGRLLKVDAAGKLLWEQRYGATVDNTVAAVSLQRIVRAGSGMVAVGEARWTNGSKRRALYLGLRADGTEAWRGQRSWQGSAWGLAPVAAGASRWFVAGASNTSGLSEYPWLALIDARGNQQWQREYPLPDGGELRTVLVTGDGSVAAVGSLTADGSAKGLIIRANAWGNTTCSAADPCLPKSATECDDNSDCTADSCDTLTAGGCVYTADDTLDCDPDDGCSTGGACKAGACIASKDGRFYHRPVAEGFSEGFNAHGVLVLPFTNEAGDPDWDAVLTGATTTSVKLNGLYYFRATVARVDRHGATRWRQWLHQYKDNSFGKLAADGEPTAVTAAAPWGDGGALLTSYVRYQKDNEEPINVPHLSALDAKGATQWTKPLQLAAGNLGTLHDIERYADGTYGVAGRIAATVGVRKLLLVRLKANGEVVWSSVQSVDKVEMQAHALATALDGSAVLAGGWRRHQWCGTSCNPTSGWEKGVASRVDNNGVAIWRVNVDGGGKDVFRAATVGKDGYVLGGESVTNAAQRSWLVAISKAGKVTWQRRSSGDNGYSITGLAIRGDELLAAGTLSLGIVNHTWIAGFSRLGTPIWHGQARLGASTLGAAHPLALLADGGLLMYGTSSLATVTTGTLARTDPWGNADCVASGKCTQTKVDGCADGKACTADLCQGAVGCDHVAVDCDDDNACTMDSCSATGGCAHVAKDCADSDACTVDTCDSANGTCAHGKPVCFAGDHCSVGTPICNAKPTCEGGVEWGGSCYTVHAGGKSWGASAAVCAALGKALVSINSVAEQDLVLGLRGQCNPQSTNLSVPIGLYYEGGWKWADGSTYSDLGMWANNPPAAENLGARISQQGRWLAQQRAAIDPYSCIVCEGYAGVCAYKQRGEYDSCGAGRECVKDVCVPCPWGSCKKG